MNMSIAEKISALVDGGEISQAQLAKECGISAAAVSNWLKGKYTGDNDGVERVMTQWMSARDRRADTAAVMPELPQWVELPTAAKKIMPVLQYAHMAGDIAVIYGGAGVSKTRTCEQYQRLYPNVWMATMSPDTSGVAGCLEECAHEIGLRDIKPGAARMRREIVSRLKRSGGLLIVDEAQHLSVQALEELRTVHDRTGIGMVLSGNESVYARLTGGSRQATFAQLFSRIGKRLRLHRPLKTDCYELAAAFGIECDPKIKAVLADIGQRPGGLRGLAKTLRLASMFAAANGGTVGKEHIIAGWKDLSSTGEDAE